MWESETLIGNELANWERLLGWVQSESIKKHGANSWRPPDQLRESVLILVVMCRLVMTDSGVTSCVVYLLSTVVLKGCNSLRIKHKAQSYLQSGTVLRLIVSGLGLLNISCWSMLYLYSCSRGYFSCWTTFPLAFDTRIMRYIWLNKCKCLQNSEQENKWGHAVLITLLERVGGFGPIGTWFTPSGFYYGFEGKPDKTVHELGLLSTWTSFVKLLDRVLRDHVTWDSLWIQKAGNSGGPFNLTRDYAA